jgi:polar amino acid transport system substrate-binding protein
LLYFLQDHGEDDLSVSVADYVRRGYGFAVPLESRLLRRLNLGLLDMQASGETERIIDGWLGTRER